MKKLFPIVSLIVALAFNTLSGGLIAGSMGLDPIVGAVTMNAIAFMPQMVKWLNPNLNFTKSGYLHEGLYKEIWLDGIKDGFYPDNSVLAKSTDLSAFVDNEKIHLAEIGVEPNVIKNNTTYPIPSAERADTPKELALDYYDTENTIIRNAKDIELSYDKVKSVVSQHRKAILKRFTGQALHAWAPNSDDTYTPVIEATGANNGAGKKKLKIADIIKLQMKYNELDFDPTGRVLVLNPQHYADILAEDVDLAKVFANTTEGSIPRLYGFEILINTLTPKFNKSNGAKVPYGAVPATTDTIASIAYCQDEVMRCMGTLEMFHKERFTNTEGRGDEIGFQARFLALSMREKCISAIYSPDA